MFQIYRLALHNEIYVDEIASLETGLADKVNYIVFKPYHTQKFVKKHPFLFKIIFKVLSNTWFVWNASLQTVLFIRHVIFKLFIKRIELFDSELALCATPRFFDQIHKVSDKLKIPRTSLIIGNVNDNNPLDFNFKLIEVCSFKDIFMAFLYSVISPYKLRGFLKESQKLHTYNSFEWFLACIYLSRQTDIKEIWFGNHIDRWAVLFDNLNIKRKIIVQHGIENGNLVPPVMLKKISKLYIIQSNQKEFFLGKIIDSDFEYEVLINKIKMTRVLDERKLRVLIVGNSAIYSEEEKYLIERLSLLNLNFCLKPHPVLSQKYYTELKKNIDFVIVSDRFTFPEVDLVISYDSTLGLEYELEGVKVLYYADNTLDEIIQYLKNSISE